MSFLYTFDPKIFKAVEPVLVRSDMNSTRSCHARESGNLGKNWISGQGRNDRGDHIQIILCNNSRIFIFFGKNQCGSSFPPFDISAPGMAFHEACGKTLGNGGKSCAVKKAEKEST